MPSAVLREGSAQDTERNITFVAQEMAAKLPLTSFPSNIRTADALSSRTPEVCSTSGRRCLPDQLHPHHKEAFRMSCKASKAEGLSYKTAGVDIDAGNELVRRIQKMNPNIGGFSGMVPFGEPLSIHAYSTGLAREDALARSPA